MPYSFLYCFANLRRQSLDSSILIQIQELEIDIINDSILEDLQPFSTTLYTSVFVLFSDGHP